MSSKGIYITGFSIKTKLLSSGYKYPSEALNTHFTELNFLKLKFFTLNNY
jgi:hypothetical protein